MIPTIKPAMSASPIRHPWLTMADTGSPAWWQKLRACGTPVIEEHHDNTCTVAFFWRDPHGNEHQSDICQVLLDINSVTDHHSWTPTSLVRISGTDIWFKTLALDATWRGSYSFIPLCAHDVPDAQRQNGDDEQQRQWWLSVVSNAVTDECNPWRSHGGGWGQASALHLPGAIPQQPWKNIDFGKTDPCQPATLKTLSWNSQRLQRQRPVWVYSSAPHPSDNLPLIILLDGRRWIEAMPILPVVAEQTQAGHMKPAVYVLIDSIDGAIRSEELPCNRCFWEAVQQELLPLVRQFHRFTDQPKQTVVVGQSFGGLAALYAALHWPERFGAVVSQSGSFWWPHDHLIRHESSLKVQPSDAVGWLGEQIQSGLGARDRLTVFMEVGRREGLMNSFNRNIRDSLLSSGHNLMYRQFDGGHDVLCWRGGVIDGIQWVLQT
ncbi:enterochelin esterase [Gynuella sp.]|uniref:enterochelin esterase n=1 Tax=Gynuella sp. TaxID=2969146 RepID=UPI003D0E4575